MKKIKRTVCDDAENKGETHACLVGVDRMMRGTRKGMCVDGGYDSVTVLSSTIII